MSRWIFRGNLTLFHYNSRHTARHACAVIWRNWAMCTGTAKFPILDMIVKLLLSLFIRLLVQNTDQNSTITEQQDARRKTTCEKRTNLKIHCCIRYPEVLKLRQSERLITLLRLVRGCIIFDIFFHSLPFVFCISKMWHYRCLKRLLSGSLPHFFDSYYRGHLDILHRW